MRPIAFKQVVAVAAAVIGVAALGACDEDTEVVQERVEVPAENEPPEAVDDTAMVSANSQDNLIAVLDNDTDADGDNLVVAAVSAPDNGGEITVDADTRLSYTPAAGFTGTETVTYTVADGRGGEAEGTLTISVSPVEVSWTLQLIHAADMEGAGNAVEDAPRFSVVLDALRTMSPDNTLVVSSGDNYIPGPFFSASDDDRLIPVIGDRGPGLGDVQMLNAMGFEVSAMGNHEFDQGTSRIKALIEMRQIDDDMDGDTDRVYPGQSFPYISTNLDFGADANLSGFVVAAGAAPQPRSISRSVVIEVDGESIGLVGATTPTLGSISSPGPDVLVTPAPFAPSPTPAQILALAAVIQAEVDNLTNAGVDKIIVLAHMQVLDIERQLATRLRDVDIIVGGGSDSILADETDRLRAGHTASGPYPERYTTASGDPLLLVNTDGQYQYVGRLVVGFDDAGHIVPESVDPNVSGAYAADDAGVAELGNPEPVTEVAEIAETIGAVLNAREGNILGATSVFLNGARSGLVGEGVDYGGVRTEETNLGNLTADANLWLAQQVDASTAISIKNGGGIRNYIGYIEQPAGSTDPSEAQLMTPRALPSAGKEEGDISQFDAQNALSFNNGLTLMTVTAAELKELVEHAVAAYPAVAGQFGQFGGIRFSFDPTLAARTAPGTGARVRSLVVVDADGALAGDAEDIVVQDGAVVGDPGRSFRVVTLNFMADGGDSYPFTALATPDRVDLLNHAGLDAGDATFAEPGSEQDALAEYLLSHFDETTPFAQADTPASEDQRIQNLSVRGDGVIAE